MRKIKRKIIWSILASMAVSSAVTSIVACTTASKDNDLKQTTLKPSLQTMKYQVGFMGDGGTDNKRYVVWEGDTVAFKYSSKTQGQNNQFNIWNDWFFQQIDNPEVPIPNNKPYSYYEAWKSTNFWGNRGKHSNRHNIPNEYVITNATRKDQGFYNMQYNYSTGSGTYYHKRFSGYPFEVIVCPKDFKINLLVDYRFSLNREYEMGETPDIDAKFIYDNDAKDSKPYIDPKNDLVHVEYQWQVKNDSSGWVNLQNNWSTNSHLPDFDFRPGKYQFRVKVRISLTQNNNMNKSNRTYEQTSDVISIKIDPKIDIVNTSISFNNYLADVSYGIQVNNSSDFDKNRLQFNWYKKESKSNNWNIIANENNGFEGNRLRIDLSKSASYKMTVSNRKDSNKSIETTPINVLEPYKYVVNNLKNESISLFKFNSNVDSKNLPTYTIYNQDLKPIILNSTIDQFGNIPAFVMDTTNIEEQSNFFIKIFNPLDKTYSLCMIQLLPKANSSNNTKQTPENNLKNSNEDSSQPKDLQPKKEKGTNSRFKIYQQWWFYLIILLCITGVGVGGYYLTRYLIDKRRQRAVDKPQDTQ